MRKILEFVLTLLFALVLLLGVLLCVAQLGQKT